MLAGFTRRSSNLGAYTRDPKPLTIGGCRAGLYANERRHRGPSCSALLPGWFVFAVVNKWHCHEYLSIFVGDDAVTLYTRRLRRASVNLIKRIYLTLTCSHCSGDHLPPSFAKRRAGRRGQCHECPRIQHGRGHNEDAFPCAQGPVYGQRKPRWSAVYCTTSSYQETVCECHAVHLMSYESYATLSSGALHFCWQIATMVAYSLQYFVLAVWSYGVAVPSGLFVPSIVSGPAHSEWSINVVI